MPKFNVLRDTYISHIGKVVKAGEQVDFELPVVNGTPMRIGDNLELIEDEPKAKGKAKKADGDDLA